MAPQRTDDISTSKQWQSHAPISWDVLCDDSDWLEWGHSKCCPLGVDLSINIPVGGLQHCFITGHPLFLFLNTLRPIKNGRRFADDIFEWIFFNKNIWISIKISLIFVLRAQFTISQHWFRQWLSAEQATSDLYEPVIPQFSDAYMRHTRRLICWGQLTHTCRYLDERKLFRRLPFRCWASYYRLSI